MQETQVWSLGREDPLEKEMATHSSSLAWKIPWAVKSGRLYNAWVHKRARQSWAYIYMYMYIFVYEHMYIHTHTYIFLYCFSLWFLKVFFKFIYFNFGHILKQVGSSSLTRDWALTHFIGRQSLNHCTSREVPFIMIYHRILNIVPCAIQ